jgi:hypothetical protein
MAEAPAEEQAVCGALPREAGAEWHARRRGLPRSPPAHGAGAGRHRGGAQRRRRWRGSNRTLVESENLNVGPCHDVAGEDEEGADDDVDLGAGAYTRSRFRSA